MQSKGFEGEGNITNWRFDQEATRKTLACMIVTDELPFKFVESKGFRKFMSVHVLNFIFHHDLQLQGTFINFI